MGNWPAFTQIPPKFKYNSYEDWKPSECCGSLFTESNNGKNKGITIWFSDKNEAEEHPDFFIESVKLVNGQYMHFKHCLIEEQRDEPEEDEEW
jgi:hypothetical protein